MPFESVNEQCLGQDDVGLELCKKSVQITFYIFSAVWLSRRIGKTKLPMRAHAKTSIQGGAVKLREQVGSLSNMTGT